MGKASPKWWKNGGFQTVKHVAQIKRFGEERNPSVSHQEAKLSRLGNSLLAAMDAELAVDADGMRFDRVGGDDQFYGDLFVGQISAEEDQHFKLAGG